MSQYFTNSDILLINLTYLSQDDLYNFCKTNKNICRNILNNNYFWKLRLENRLGLISDDKNLDYKNISLTIDNEHSFNDNFEQAIDNNRPDIVMLLLQNNVVNPALGHDYCL